MVINNSAIKHDPYEALSVAYVFLPIILFVLGWLRPYIALPLALLMSICYFFVCSSICTKNDGAKVRGGRLYWSVSAIVVFIWVLYSGIGGFSYQNWDYFLRNPVYRDLSSMKWPVFYNLSKQPDAVRAITGDGTAAFTYYCCFWLPPALLTKLLRCNEAMSNLFLLMWEYAGVMLTVYQIHRHLKRASFGILAVFIFFSGLDIVGVILSTGKLEYLFNTEHIEWWAKYIQYSSNTTVLYWVFNQAVPVWLITALFLNANKASGAGLCALSFAYSPFATIGIVPLAIYSAFKKGESFKRAVSIQNVAITAIMLLVFGAYYASNPQNTSTIGLGPFMYPALDYMKKYAVFIVLEVGVYAIMLRSKIRVYDYLLASLLVLLLIPLFYIRSYDFVMRSSLSALFILSVSIMQYLLEDTDKKNKIALAIILLLGADTAFHEIYRSIRAKKPVPIENVHSIARIGTEDEGMIKGCLQYLTLSPEKTFFFKYMAEK